MTANIPASIFNVLVLAFFIIAALGVALGAYAAVNMKKAEKSDTE
jgi:hypothetical protein